MKRILLAAALLALAVPALAGYTTEWRVNLVRTGGSSAGTFKGTTLAEAMTACTLAADSLGARASGYDCQTPRLHVTVTADPPAAVDCQVSDWSAPVVGEWSACVNNVQTRTTTRTRTVTTAPANGGKACPQLTDSTVESRSCTVEPPAPVDCAVSDWSAWSGGAWSACSNGTQTRTETRTRTITTQPANGGAACPSLSESRTASQPCTDTPPPAGAIAFYGVSSRPSCLTRVPAYTFDAVAHTVTRTFVPADTSGLPVHSGRCLAATPATLNKTFWNGVQPGDVVTAAAGTYTTTFGEGTWYGAMGETYKKGTAAQPIAVIAAEGASVAFKASGRPPLVFGNGDRATEFGAYLGFDGIAFTGSASCVSGGGHTTDPSGGPNETGGRYIRWSGGSCTITDRSSNTMTGLVDLQSDGWKILGVEFHDPANRVVINNNHVVYIQGGADDVEVAYNRFVGLHSGHVVQIHQDANVPKSYQNVSLHDNYYRATNYNDMRGISVVNVSDDSTIFIKNETLEHLGWDDWGCLNIYGGVTTADNLTCVDTHYGIYFHGQQGGDHYGGTIRKVVLSNSKLCPSAGVRVAYTAGATASGGNGTSFTETGAKACP